MHFFFAKYCMCTKNETNRKCKIDKTYAILTKKYFICPKTRLLSPLTDISILVEAVLISLNFLVRDLAEKTD